MHYALITYRDLTPAMGEVTLRVGLASGKQHFSAQLNGHPAVAEIKQARSNTQQHIRMITNRERSAHPCPASSLRWRASTETHSCSQQPRGLDETNHAVASAASTSVSHESRTPSTTLSPESKQLQLVSRWATVIPLPCVQQSRGRGCTASFVFVDSRTHSTTTSLSHLWRR